MSVAEATGTQARKALPDAHQGYPGVAAVESSSRRVSGGGVRSNKEGNIEKQLRGQGNRVMIPQFQVQGLPYVLLKRAGPRYSQVEGCSDQAVTCTAMRVHFCPRHLRDTLVILD